MKLLFIVLNAHTEKRNFKSIYRPVELIAGYVIFPLALFRNY